MRLTFRRAGWLGLSLLVVAAMPARARVTIPEPEPQLFQWLLPVDSTADSVNVLGCSVRVPGHEHWKYASSSGWVEGFFVRDRISATHSAYARVWGFGGMKGLPQTPDQMLAEAREFLLGQQGNKIVLVEQSFELDPMLSPRCVRFHWKALQRDVRGHAGEEFTLTATGLLLEHPDAPGMLIGAMFSERWGPGESESQDSIAADYLRSFRCTRPDPGVVRSFQLGGSVGAIVIAQGSLWVTATGLGEFYGGRDELVRFDPVSMVETARIRLGGGAWDLAATDDAIWATLPDQHLLVRIDPRTNQVTRRVPCGKRPELLASLGNDLFVADARSPGLWKFDGTSGKLAATRNRDVVEPCGVAIADSVVWVTDLSSHTALRIDPGSLVSLDGAITVEEGPYDLCAGEGRLWVKCFDARTIDCLDSRTRTRLASVKTPGPWVSGLVADRDGVWVCDYVDGTLAHLDAGTGRFAERVLHVGVRPVSLALADDAIWITDGATGELRRVALP